MGAGVGVGDGSVGGASVYTRKNSGHVLKDNRMVAFLQVCVLQKRWKMGTKE